MVKLSYIFLFLAKREIIPSAEERKALNALKVTSEPWDEVIRLWRATSKYRMSCLEDGSMKGQRAGKVRDALNAYRVLRQKKGFELVSSSDSGTNDTATP